MTILSVLVALFSSVILGSLVALIWRATISNIRR